MSDPLATHHRHEGLIQRQELRRLASNRERYFDTPHLIYDGMTTTIGLGPFPTISGGGWSVPAGAWRVQAAFSSAPSPYIRARSGGVDDTRPEYEAQADYVSGDGLGGSTSLAGQLELAPVVSDGTLTVWFSAGADLIVFARLSR